jgi:hypothetical protein
MKRAEVICAMQVRCARVAVGASTVRGQGAPGIVKEAREFLAVLALARFGTSSPARFRRQLDHSTQDLMHEFPKPARSWGLARKVLNIFLRDALYTVYLRNEFRLDRAEALLELPLDSKTVGHLRREVGRGQLPRWSGVKHLTPSDSEVFQKRAAIRAAFRRVERVHLDAIWWTDQR